MWQSIYPRNAAVSANCEEVRCLSYDIPQRLANPKRGSSNRNLARRHLDSNSPCVCSRYFLYAPESEFGRNHYCNPHNAMQIMYNKLRTFQSACYSHNAYLLCRVASWSKYPVLISRANDHICRCFIHQKDKSAATISYRQISYFFSLLEI
jgi:hypothetical protein